MPMPFSRIFLPLLLLLQGFHPALAQLTVTRMVVATSGQTAQGGSLRVDWTLGESFVARQVGGSLLLQEGFQQGLSGPANALDPALATSTWRVFPQPASQHLHLQYEAAPGSRYRLRLLDLAGRELYQTPLPTGWGPQVQATPLSGWPPGVYLIQVIQDNQQRVFEQKWLKI